MTIKLYTNTSPANFVTKNITQIGSDHTGTLRQETSIINPVIMLEASSVPASANYLYISDFARYYFIEDIVSVRNGLWEIHCKVDPLTSFKTELKACKGIVHRAEGENAYNTNLDDGAFRAYCDPHIVTMAFPGTFNSWSYILAVAGGGASE